MKVFIVYCHPSEDSFTRNVRDAFIKGIVDSGNEYIMSDLDHIGNVAHPQLVGAKRDEILHQVGIQGQVVVGVGRLGTALLLAHFQVILLDDVVETVVAHAVFRTELAPVHLPKFGATDAGGFLPHMLDVLHAERLLGQLAQLTVPMLIVGLG